MLIRLKRKRLGRSMDTLTGHVDGQYTEVLHLTRGPLVRPSIPEPYRPLRTEAIHPAKPSEREVDLTLFEPVRAHLYSHVIGQRALIDSLLIGLLSEGHMLIERAPRRAGSLKKAMSQAMHTSKNKVQCR